MRNTRVLAAALTALMLSVLALTVTVAALAPPYTYSANMYTMLKPAKDYSDPNTNPNGANTLTWLIDTLNAVDVNNNPASFSGKTVTSLNLYYATTVDANNNPVYVTIDPTAIKQIHYKTNTIEIVLDATALPSNALINYVDGTLSIGETFISIGPGWTYIHH